MPRRPSSFPPPSLLEPDVRAALADAIAKGEHVVVYLRGDPDVGGPEPKVVGVPLRASPSKDGRARIAVETRHGATQQLVLVEQIVRIVSKGRH